MIAFILGIFVGSTLGVFTMALMSMTREDFETYDSAFDDVTNEKHSYVSRKEQRDKRRFN